MLSDLSPTNKERQVYETIIEANREYEILDKDNRPQYEDVKTPPPKPKPEVEAVQMQPLPSPGDCGEFTQCPAYAVPMATTSIHSNKDEQEAVSEPASPSTSKSE